MLNVMQAFLGVKGVDRQDLLEVGMRVLTDTDFYNEAITQALHGAVKSYLLVTSGAADAASVRDTAADLVMVAGASIIKQERAEAAKVSADTTNNPGFPPRPERPNKVA